MELQQSFTNWSPDEVALELSYLVGNKVDTGLTLVANLVVGLTNLLLLFLGHALFDFLGLGEVCGGNAKGHVVIRHPLLARQRKLTVLGLEHLSAAVLKDLLRRVALE